MKRNGGKFKKLEREWYDRLAQEGFRDIEDTRTYDRKLKEWDFNFFRNSFDQIRHDASIEYFERAHILLRTYCFENESDRRVWELHCQGLSVRKIEAQVTHLRKTCIHDLIAKIAKKIKI